MRRIPKSLNRVGITQINPNEMKRIINTIFLISILVMVSCQKEDDLFEEQLSVENTEDIKVIEDLDELDLNKSTQFLHCANTPVPPGFRIVSYLNHSSCSSIVLYLGLYNAAIIESEAAVLTPSIYSAGAGCDDYNCIWIVGDNFEPNAYVDIRTTSGSAIIGTYRGTDRTQYVNAQGQDVITLRLRSAYEINQFATNGLRIWVVNPEARTWADGRTVNRPNFPFPL